jgi:glutamate 5-kinase
VVKVEGVFDRGDAVVIQDSARREIGRGLIAYASHDAERLLGCKSAEIEGILGYRGRSEMIHRDDMAFNRSG